MVVCVRVYVIRSVCLYTIGIAVALYAYTPWYTICFFLLLLLLLYFFPSFIF